SPAALAADPTLAAVPLSSNPQDAKQAVSALLEEAAQSAVGTPRKAGGGNFQSGLASAVSDARGLSPAGRLDLAAREPALSGLLLGGEVGDTLLKPAQRLANKFSGLAANAGVEGAWGHQALLAGSRVSASATLASTPTQSLESMVADTVSYWTTQGVQNAELKLDGFGDEAVAVRISLKGDQAHIGFRTDQPEIRQMLEGALAHLKEVLKSEGLVLSGVSVGSSGQNGAGPREQRDRADSRQSGQTSLITPDAAPVPGRQRVNPAVGRALDMFV
ncbi:MAG: flagellar hook-length control protein FliK, partial [Gallionella sp.]|nr:flagellar hook-length control protein FliK [Gallionella sp.]